MRAVALCLGLATLAMPGSVAAQSLGTDHDWTGPSIGLALGYADVRGADVGVANPSEGGVLGLRLHYDHDFGSVIAGALVHYDFYGDAFYDSSANDVEWFLRVGARFGIDSGRNWYYASAGYAEAQTNFSNAVIDRHVGYFIGLGYEAWVTDSLTMGAEIIFHDLEEVGDPDITGEITHIALSLNWRF